MRRMPPPPNQFVELGEGEGLAGASPRTGVGLVGDGLEAGEALGDVGEEAGLALLAVADDVDACLDLLADDVVHGALDGGVVGSLVVGLAAFAGGHEVEEALRGGRGYRRRW